jgi:heptosyltransferase I
VSPLLRRHRSRRVCIVHLTGIGDVVHGLALALDLKRDDPSRHLVWVAEPAPAGVLRHHPAVDEVVVFHKTRGLAGIRELRDALRPRSSDLTINLQRYAKSIFPTLLSGAPVRLGLPRSMTRDGTSLFHTHHLTERPWCHTQDLVLAFREPLGLPADTPVEWRITFAPHEVEARDTFFRDLPGTGPVAGLVLATANRKKDWPAPRYATLARALLERGWRVLLVGGPGAREREAARVVEGAVPQVVDGRGDSVRRMMWMVDGVDLLVSPDTGPLHVAHAVGTPVVGIFGHSNPARVGPWRRYRELVVDHYTEPGEGPDPSRYAPRSGRMETIDPGEVLERVDQARDRYGVGPGTGPGASTIPRGDP